MFTLNGVEDDSMFVVIFVATNSIVLIERKNVANPVITKITSNQTVLKTLESLLPK